MSKILIDGYTEIEASELKEALDRLATSVASYESVNKEEERLNKAFTPYSECNGRVAAWEAEQLWEAECRRQVEARRVCMVADTLVSLLRGRA